MNGNRVLGGQHRLTNSPETTSWFRQSHVSSVIPAQAGNQQVLMDCSGGLQLGLACAGVTGDREVISGLFLTNTRQHQQPKLHDLLIRNLSGAEGQCAFALLQMKRAKRHRLEIFDVRLASLDAIVAAKMCLLLEAKL